MTHDMDSWIRQAAKPGGKKTGTSTPAAAEQEPFVPGEGAGEGGARGRAAEPDRTMDDWLRRASGRRFSWEETLDASDFGLEQGRPEVNR